MQVTFVVLNVIFGLLTCFFGYRLLRFWLAVMGWQVGVTAVTAMAGSRINGDVLTFVLAILAGFVLALIFYALFRPAVFIAGALLFGYLAYLVLLSAGKGDLSWTVIPIGLAGGILTLLAHRPILIFITALGGALAVVDNGAAFFLDRLPVPLLRLQTPIGGLPLVLYVLAFVILFALGMVAQFRQSDHIGVSRGVFDAPDRHDIDNRERHTPYRSSRHASDDPAVADSAVRDDASGTTRDDRIGRRPPDDRERRG